MRFTSRDGRGVNIKEEVLMPLKLCTTLEGKPKIIVIQASGDKLAIIILCRLKINIQSGGLLNYDFTYIQTPRTLMKELLVP